jgi:hypothetical protein
MMSYSFNISTFTQVRHRLDSVIVLGAEDPERRWRPKTTAPKHPTVVTAEGTALAPRSLVAAVNWLRFPSL